jgi:hypothetical protein
MREMRRIATVTVIPVLSFYLFPLNFLKNYSKSQKNHKMKNSILLDSTRVLHSEHKKDKTGITVAMSLLL